MVPKKFVFMVSCQSSKSESSISLKSPARYALLINPSSFPNFLIVSFTKFSQSFLSVMSHGIAMTSDFSPISSLSLFNNSVDLAAIAIFAPSLAAP